MDAVAVLAAAALVNVIQVVVLDRAADQGQRAVWQHEDAATAAGLDR